MGIVVHPGPGVRDAHPLQHLDGPRPGVLLAGALVLAVDLGDLPADRVIRRQRGQRVLEDHGDPVAPELLHRGAVGADELLVLQPDLPAHLGVGGVVQAEDRQVGDRLARAGLAHDAEGGALLQVEREAVHRVDDAVLGAELHGQVADRQERPGTTRCSGLAVPGDGGHLLLLEFVRLVRMAGQTSLTRGSMKA